jgi:hypothetical protein
MPVSKDQEGGHNTMLLNDILDFYIGLNVQSEANCIFPVVKFHGKG